jgi:two-component system cell cycle response regulator
VEDSDGDFETIRASLNEQEQILLTRAGTIAEAMQLLEQDQFELVLLDHVLPDGDGIDFLKSLEKKGVEIPVVVITGQGNEMIASQLIQAGAYDYLSKDMVSNVALSRSIANTMEKAFLKREIREAKKKMAESKTIDELTGLYTRKYFMEVLEREVARSKRYGTELVLCMMDLDHFKQINDTHGNLAGDMVLSEVGKMLKKCMRQSDLVSRCGDEELAVILSHTQAESAWTVCERFREMVATHKFKYDSSSFTMTVSIGFSSFDHSSSETPLDLIERVAKALSQAKKGRNRVIEYNR